MLLEKELSRWGHLDDSELDLLLEKIENVEGNFLQLFELYEFFITSTIVPMQKNCTYNEFMQMVVLPKVIKFANTFDELDRVKKISWSNVNNPEMLYERMVEISENFQDMERALFHFKIDSRHCVNLVEKLTYKEEDFSKLLEVFEYFDRVKSIYFLRKACSKILDQIILPALKDANASIDQLIELHGMYHETSTRWHIYDKMLDSVKNANELQRVIHYIPSDSIFSIKLRKIILKS